MRPFLRRPWIPRAQGVMRHGEAVVRTSIQIFHVREINSGRSERKDADLTIRNAVSICGNAPLGSDQGVSATPNPPSAKTQLTVEASHQKSSSCSIVTPRSRWEFRECGRFCSEFTEQFCCWLAWVYNSHLFKRQLPGRPGNGDPASDSGCGCGCGSGSLVPASRRVCGPFSAAC
jgi:hypothetical protein